MRSHADAMHSHTDAMRSHADACQNQNQNQKDKLIFLGKQEEDRGFGGKRERTRWSFPQKFRGKLCGKVQNSVESLWICGNPTSSHSRRIPHTKGGETARTHVSRNCAGSLTSLKQSLLHGLEVHRTLLQTTKQDIVAHQNLWSTTSARSFASTKRGCGPAAGTCSGRYPKRTRSASLWNGC